MGNTSPAKSPLVRRITIDEKLASDLIRVLVAELKSGTEAFNNDPSYWNEEAELLIQEDDYQKMMDMNPNNVKKWPWNSLYEGQTFLQGYFRIADSRQNQPRFLVDTRKKNFRCIDTLIKKHVKTVYLSALEGRRK